MTKYASILDVIECKGRLGPRGTMRERFWIAVAKRIASVIMREPDIRKEFAIALAVELKRMNAWLDPPPNPAPPSPEPPMKWPG